MTQSVANPSPKAEFPAIREKYREFAVFEADPGAGSAQSREITALQENSLEFGAGNPDLVTGNFVP
jgi:hypothetical protein